MQIICKLGVGQGHYKKMFVCVIVIELEIVMAISKRYFRPTLKLDLINENELRAEEESRLDNESTFVVT